MQKVVENCQHFVSVSTTMSTATLHELLLRLHCLNARERMNEE
jgi:hypothetical protein